MSLSSQPVAAQQTTIGTPREDRYARGLIRPGRCQAIGESTARRGGMAGGRGQGSVQRGAEAKISPTDDHAAAAVRGRSRPAEAETTTLPSRGPYTRDSPLRRGSDHGYVTRS